MKRHRPCFNKYTNIPAVKLQLAIYFMRKKDEISSHTFRSLRNSSSYCIGRFLRKRGKLPNA